MYKTKNLLTENVPWIKLQLHKLNITRCPLRLENLNNEDAKTLETNFYSPSTEDSEDED